jgi:hypothetical protein
VRVMRGKGGRRWVEAELRLCVGVRNVLGSVWDCCGGGGVGVIKNIYIYEG